MPLPRIFLNVEGAIDNDFPNHDQFIGVAELELDDEPLQYLDVSDIITYYISHNHTSSIKNVKFFLRPFKGGTALVHRFENEAPFNINNSNNKLSLRFDDENDNTIIDLDEGATVSASTISNNINSQFGELCSFVVGNYVYIYTPSVGKRSKIFLPTGSTSESVLGFSVDDYNPVQLGDDIKWGWDDEVWRGNTSLHANASVSFPCEIVVDDNDKFILEFNKSQPITITISPGVYANYNTLVEALNSSLSDFGFGPSDLLFDVLENKLILYNMTKNNQDGNLVITNHLTQNVLSELGFSQPDSEFTDYTIIGKHFSNFSSVQDYNELLSWGNQGYGLEIGPSTNDSFIRISSDVGSNITNAIHMNWGEGVQRDEIKEFDFVNPSEQGEVGVSIRLTIPPDVKVGKRQFSISVFFTY